MPIPTFQNLTLPVLRILADGGEHSAQALIDQLSHEFKLTEAERAELLPSGRQRKMANRVHWAITYLARCLVVERTRRGHVRISPRGTEVLARNPERVDLAFLSQFPELDQFRYGVRDRETAADISPSPETIFSTPDERLRGAFEEIQAVLREELLLRLRGQSPVFFEQTVVELLRAMGFSGQHGTAAQLGGSGDDGVDGVVDQDALGLDRIYVQAKRWAEGRNVSSGDIRNFSGSLAIMRASKGVFLTTSSFTRDARDTAERLPNRIVLIDGETLADLMIKYDVGVRTEEVIKIRKIDEDFFLQGF